jgi:hypothetical protein
MNSPLSVVRPAPSSAPWRQTAAAVWAAALAWAAPASGQVVVNLHYQDRPPCSEAAADGSARDPVADPAAPALAQAGAVTLAALFGDTAQPLLVKDGYSYGPLLDDWIARHPAAVRRTSAESAQMVRMIDAARAGWMIVAPEEAGTLLAGLAGATDRLRLVPLPGVPAGPTRHVYCNRSVPDVVIERFDRAIAAL